MWFRPSVIIFLILFTANCSKQSSRRTIPMPTQVARVIVKVDGKVYLNGKLIPFEQLKGEFRRLKDLNGAVWFLDESSVGASREQGARVRKAIIEAELPMRVR